MIFIFRHGWVRCKYPPSGKDRFPNVDFSIFWNSPTTNNFCSDTLNNPPPPLVESQRMKRGVYLERTQLKKRIPFLFLLPFSVFRFLITCLKITSLILIYYHPLPPILATYTISLTLTWYLCPWPSPHLFALLINFVLLSMLLVLGYWLLASAGFFLLIL